MTEVIILGLDGATWDVMTPLIEEEGKLPHIASLMRNGCWGTLKSLRPILTPVIWTSIATGKLPEKHGVTKFFSTTADLTSKRLWDILESRGKSVGLFEWPITWPPRPVNGFLVPCSSFARSTATYPFELAFIQELDHWRGQKLWDNVKLFWQGMAHGVKLGTFIQMVRYRLAGQRSSAGHLVRETAIARLFLHQDVYSHLLRVYDPYFGAFYTNIIDSFSHRCWHYYQPELFPDSANEEDIQRFGHMIPRAYEMLDKVVGRILGQLDNSTLVCVVSDHGFEAGDWHGAEVFIPSIRGDVLLQKSGLADEIDYVHCNQDLRLDFKGGSGSKDRKLEIINLLRSLKVVETGWNLFTAKEDKLGSIILSLDHFDEFVVAELSGLTVQLPTETCQFLELINENRLRTITGAHSIDGIFIMSGNNVKKDYRIEDASVLDVTPTLLALLGLPVGEDMDGRVLEEVIEEKFLAENPTHHIPTYETEQIRRGKEDSYEDVPDVVLERLRDLGYID